MDKLVCAVCVCACVWATWREAACATENMRESGRWPEGGSGKHRPHNSLIMPLRGNSQLLMAFALCERGWRGVWCFKMTVLGD